MILKAYYAGGRIDVFDTDHLVDCTPQPGNLLVNYTLDLTDVNGESLWLRSYYYEAAQAYKNESGPTGLPIARRRDGWSFLIADEEDLEKLNRLTMDGETVLAQIAGELIDMTALSWAYSIADEYSQMILRAYSFFTLTTLNGEGDTEDSLYSDIGVPQKAFEWIANSVNNQTPEEPRF